MRAWLLLHFVAAPIFCAILPKTNHNKLIEIERPNNQTTQVGQICMTVEHFRPNSNESQSFFECAPLSEEERKEYDIQSKYLGVWTVRKCAEGFSFDGRKQKCVDKKKLHRQQAQCLQNPGTMGCQQYCQPNRWSEPSAGAACNWQYSLLYYTPEDTHSFLQCAQTSAADPCGEWIRIDCPANTAFDLNMQLCIPVLLEDSSKSCSAANQIAVCKCGQQSHSCPGISTCTSDVCCATVNPYDLLLPNQPVVYQDYHYSVPVCAGSGTYPIASCTASCPQTYTCQPNIGCCPAIFSIVQPAPAPAPTTTAAPQPKSIVIQLQTCPSTNSQPISSCGSCPTGYICAPLLGACCPVATPPPVVITAPPATQPPPQPPMMVMLCPSGQLPTSTCSSSASCPSGSSCYQGQCCPCQCPPQQVMIGICANGLMNAASCAANGASCHNGCCCSEAPKLPVCSNGQQSTMSCQHGMQCGPKMECSNGGCCPIPYCPTGQQAMSRCTTDQSCGLGTICLEGLCCSLPTCNNGQAAQSICTVSSQCPPTSTCQNGGCCALPTCPTGNMAVSTCSPSCSPQPQSMIISIPAMPSPQPVSSCCSSGQQCVNGGCCQLPTCPTTGSLALMMCSPSTPCPQGTSCSGGGCCPLPLCPSGQQAISQCSPTSSCPQGTTCTNGICCQLPVCTYGGQVAMSFCGPSNACPSGSYCEQGSCCPQPVPLCPSGGRSVMQCVRGSDCPTGYGCTSSGGCCKLVTDFLCPMNALPVCQCSPTMSCPVGTACTSGMCCTTSHAVMMTPPGTSCQASSQCSGYHYDQPNADCSNDICICIKGALSNGVTCEIKPPVTIEIARNGCDEYGSPCKYMLSSVRRRPVFSPTKNATEKPLWYNTALATTRRCPLMSDNDIDPDSTCLPNEKCINGECKLKLWPGEYGCESNSECQARCPGTYCEFKTDRNVAQCQCSNGMLLYGRCFETCPKGFHESGSKCEHDDEEAFWVNSGAQTELQSLLNAGTC